MIAAAPDFIYPDPPACSWIVARYYALVATEPEASSWPPESSSNNHWNFGDIVALEQYTINTLIN